MIQELTQYWGIIYDDVIFFKNYIFFFNPPAWLMKDDAEISK